MAWFVPGVNILATLGMLALSAYGQHQADKQYRNSLDQYDASVKREKEALIKAENEVGRNTNRRIAGATHGVYRNNNITNSMIDNMIKEKEEAIKKKKEEINKVWEHPRAQAGKDALKKSWEKEKGWSRR